jgi:enamine deaminase RidA (YjgF/YER057c/UK114 family)
MTARPQEAFARTPEQLLDELALELPDLGGATGRFVRCVQTGNVVFVAGHGPVEKGRPVFLGRLGDGMTLEEGRRAAVQSVLGVLATLKDALGELSRIRRIVKVLVFVSSTADFTDQHLVANSASELLESVFGLEKGSHARSAVGVASLPYGFSVEIELVAEVDS